MNEPPESAEDRRKVIPDRARTHRELGGDPRNSSSPRMGRLSTSHWRTLEGAHLGNPRDIGWLAHLLQDPACLYLGGDPPKMRSARVSEGAPLRCLRPFSSSIRMKQAIGRTWRAQGETAERLLITLSGPGARRARPPTPLCSSGARRREATWTFLLRRAASEQGTVDHLFGGNAEKVLSSHQLTETTAQPASIRPTASLAGS